MTDPLLMHVAVLQAERMRDAQRWRARRRARPDAATHAAPPTPVPPPRRRLARATR